MTSHTMTVSGNRVTCSKVLAMVVISVCLLVPLLAIFISHHLTTSFSAQIIRSDASHEERPRELDTSQSLPPLDGWSNTPSSVTLPPGEHFLTTILFSQSSEQRESIRNTWKRYSNASEGSLVMFALGIKEISPKVYENLSAEQAKHKDIILLRDVGAESDNTIKAFHIFRWLDKNLKYSYALISNDYCFIRLDKLTQELRKRTNKVGLYWGYFVGNAAPQKAGPWAENRWFLCDRYLPYALSGGYILSSDIIHRVMLNSDLIQLYNNEDVSVGVWTSAFNIERRHDIRFDVEARSRGCKNDFMIICTQSADDLEKKYSRLQKRVSLCETERVFREYRYNWTARPSKCCE